MSRVTWVNMSQPLRCFYTFRYVNFTSSHPQLPSCSSTSMLMAVQMIDVMMIYTFLLIYLFVFPDAGELVVNW